MSQQITVARLDQLGPSQRILVKVNGQEIALFNLEGTIYAISNRCPHSKGPLNEGRLSGTTVICPWHGAKFDIVTGQCLEGPATTDSIIYSVTVKDNDIIIDIP